MKKIVFSIGILACLGAGVCAYAQGNSGYGFNHQAVVYGSDGFVLPNQNVELRFSLMPGQSAAQASWEETHSVTTDARGTIAVTVGKGTKTGGIAATFADVNFAAVHYWLKVEIKDGGGTYRELSYTALASVPYAEAAAVAANTACSPVGSVMAFAGDTSKIPEGWLLCDGSEVSRSAYAALYAAIGTAWGYGDNATTFNLPDMRGMFLRGVTGDVPVDSNAATRIPLKDGGNSGNNVGSYQGDAIRNITANGGYWEKTANIPASRLTGAFYANGSNLLGAQGIDSDNAQVGFDASRVVPVGSDNRPKNVYVNYIIKY